MLSIEDHPSEIQSKVGECHQKWLTATKRCPYMATYITVHRCTWTCPLAGIKLRHRPGRDYTPSCSVGQNEWEEVLAPN
jgi:hypothetical protein